MGKIPLVSVIMPFYNTPPEFFQEAIDSVYAQDYSKWELLLADDGSSQQITRLAKSIAGRSHGRVLYCEHKDHVNKGNTAARNLGFQFAKGKYVAFLDADDIWMPQKLDQQVAILESNPEVGMLYANTQYWYSWTGKPDQVNRDFIPNLGVQSNAVFPPPTLLPLFLSGKAAVPSINTLLVRRDAMARYGGFDESFRSLYGDQHFYAKLCLSEYVYVSGACVDRYRQHPESMTGQAHKKGLKTTARKYFLQWLERYLIQMSINDIQVWRTLRREMWLINFPLWMSKRMRIQRSLRWAKKWILRAEERLLPEFFRQTLWLHNKK